MRLKLIVAYDGASFSGWQSQPGGNTVQDLLETAFARINGGRVVVHASGRTDAGVHALAQCAHATVTRDTMKPDEWLRALNGNLPRTIRVMKATRTADNFHARFSAKRKIYRYHIRCSEVTPPHEWKRVWNIPQSLDLARLRAAAKVFEGKHDFAAFAASRGVPVKDTRRTIRRVTVAGSGTSIRLTFEGDGFLYKMVRMLTGAAVSVARGQATVGELRARLKDGAPQWTHVAPADGLYLVRVIY